MKYGGALPMQHIRDLVEGGFIENADPGNVRTGSLDVTVTDQLYRVNGAFLPGPDETVEKAFKRVGAVALPERSILERGSCYVYKLAEHVNHLPREVYGYANPKSSSGRLDIHVRLLADKVSRYDSVPERYAGPLWALVAPKKFPVIVRPGLALCQLRGFNQDTRLDEFRLETAFERDGGLLSTPQGDMIYYRDIVHSDHDGSVILTLGLDYQVPGFEAIETNEPIDLSQVGYYEPEQFFRPITMVSGSITLAPNAFYILSTWEYVRVPERFACEMAPMDERSGELRSHYAGFIDPGWGIGLDGAGRGRPLTLEVRSFDSSIIIRNRQPIAKIKYERMVEKPEHHYDQMTPHYGNQFGPALSKHFKPWRK